MPPAEGCPKGCRAACPFGIAFIMQAWISQSSEWLVIQAVEVPSDSDLDNLDLGEQATIVLAVARGENLVILDDLLGKQVALACYLRVIGLVGVLDEAARQNLVDFSGAIARLQRTTFRVSLKLI